jgi:hypothetical protein
VEVALAGYGFTGDNSIAMSNLCRDESCMILEDKIESVFGSCEIALPRKESSLQLVSQLRDCLEK